MKDPHHVHWYAGYKNVGVPDGSTPIFPSFSIFSCSVTVVAQCASKDYERPTLVSFLSALQANSL
jgi:hypothetical protein